MVYAFSYTFICSHNYHLLINIITGRSHIVIILSTVELHLHLVSHEGVWPRHLFCRSFGFNLVFFHELVNKVWEEQGVFPQFTFIDIVSQK